MSKKIQQLKNDGVLNPNPETVSDELFQNNEFFDPNDLVQVKYEMIRKVEKEKCSVSEASNNFGFSRPSFYHAKSSLETEGIRGLIPKQRGPKDGHKITDEIVRYILKTIEKNGPYKSEELTKIVKNKFKLEVHPRTIERAIGRKKKVKGQKK